jgi:hypothetical protein
MATVYVLMWAVDYEGENLLGVYASQEEADAAGQAWEFDHVLGNYERLVVYPIELGAPASL